MDGVLQQLLVVVSGGVRVCVWESAAPTLVVVSRNHENGGANLEWSDTCTKGGVKQKKRGRER